GEFADSVEVGQPAGIQVRDFVLPKGFTPGWTGQFDGNKKTDEPLKLLPGGYMSVFTSGKGWTQINAHKGGELVAAGDDPKSKQGVSRLARYGRDHTGIEGLT